MGAGLAGDRQALSLGLADQGHALLGGDVADVVAAAGFMDQLEVPLHLPPLALRGVAGETVGPGVGAVVDAPALLEQRFVLAVGYNWLVQRFGQLHGPAHLLRGLDALAVVGKAHGIRGHGRKICQFLALFASGDGAVGIDADRRVPGNGLQLRTEAICTVRHRLEVGHGAHGGVTACRSSGSAGGNGLLIRKTRLTQMHMHIGETWNKKTIMQFDHTKAIPRKRGGNGNNTALVNGNIQTLKTAVPEHAAAGQQILHGSPPSVFVFGQHNILSETGGNVNAFSASVLTKNSIGTGRLSPK